MEISSMLSVSPETELRKGRFQTFRVSRFFNLRVAGLNFETLRFWNLEL